MRLIETDEAVMTKKGGRERAGERGRSRILFPASSTGSRSSLCVSFVSG